MSPKMLTVNGCTARNCHLGGLTKALSPETTEMTNNSTQHRGQEEVVTVPMAASAILQLSLCFHFHDTSDSTEYKHHLDKYKRLISFSPDACYIAGKDS